MEVGESEHSGRGFRQRKGRTSPMCCPICGVTLRLHEIDHHFAVEVDRLERILKPKKQLPYGAGGAEDGPTAGPSYSNGEGPSHSGSGQLPAARSNGHNSEETVASPAVGPDECWGTYQKIKNNRQARLKVARQLAVHPSVPLKSRKRKPEDNVCPICNKVTLDDITLHVEACLRKSEPQRNGTNATAQRRRHSSALRELLIANDPPVVKPPAEGNPGEGTSKSTAPPASSGPPTSLPAGLEGEPDPATGTERRIIESLKAKIREYEGYIQNRPKCLICMDDFRKPIVSVCCWHVYCEECWLHTLGAKKLCPQCSMITSPTDLRRIYL
uniref:RING-type domain-containing protein n=1 Tax=Anopheles coluzzii TaxID=1518534 RepID=A0A8W7PQ65_ANOCL